MKKGKVWLGALAVLSLALGVCFLGGAKEKKSAKAESEFTYELDLESAPKTKISFSYAIGNYMLFQQGKPAVVWGFCPAGHSVKVSLFYQKGTSGAIEEKTAVATSDGYFEVQFSPREASYTEYKLVAVDEDGQSGEDTVSAEHILFGELYLSCGQSNMGLNVQYCSNAEELLDDENPYIRVYLAPTFSSSASFSYLPTAYDSEGFWTTGESRTQIGGVSAVSYNFITKLFAELNQGDQKVPCGFLNTAKGATSIEAWISRASIDTDHVVEEYLSTRGRLLTKEQFNTNGSNNYNQVSAMFNSSIAPLSRFYVKGILWFQGENNVGNETAGVYYRSALKLLRKDWSKWYNGGQEELSLFFVELTPGNYSREKIPSSSYKPENLAYMWEGMTEAYTDEPQYMSMTTTYDVPQDWYNEDFAYRAPTHMLVKKPIGERMATYALNRFYDGFEGYDSAPVYKEATFGNGKATVSFLNCAELKTVNAVEDVIGFTLCGSNRIFYPAKAKILQNGKVEVFSEWVKEPVAVAYGFSMMNQSSNLCNEVGHVVSPFRSDKVASTYYSAKDWHDCDALELWISEGSDTARTPDLAMWKNAYTASGIVNLSIDEDGYYGNALKVAYSNLRGRQSFYFSPVLNQAGVYEQFGQYDTLFFRVKNGQNRKVELEKVEIKLADGRVGTLCLSDGGETGVSIEKGDYTPIRYSLNQMKVGTQTVNISSLRSTITDLKIYFRDYLDGYVLLDDFMLGNQADFVGDTKTPNEPTKKTEKKSGGCSGNVLLPVALPMLLGFALKKRKEK